jgi:2Fe-2S ferredoxin
MVQVRFIGFDGEETRVDVQPGYSLMEGAIANGIDGIEAACGGNSYCGTCRVYVDPAWFEKTGARTETELTILESIDDPEPTLRLSCQIQVAEHLDGLVVRIPEHQS